MTATIQRDLRESSGLAGVKAGPGLLKNVKVLGLVSQNRRRYLPEAVRAALPLYEGALVNIDHPTKGDEPRPLDSRFGRLVNARLTDGGIYADLKYNPAHRMAESVRWWAENDPSALGLSHNAVGAGRTDDGGVYVVEKILAVRSVDLVADPATTKGLFESRRDDGGRRRVFSPEESARLRQIMARDRFIAMNDDEALAALEAGRMPRPGGMSGDDFLAAIRR